MASSAAAGRPGSITAAAVILIILGVILTLFGLIFALVGVFFPTLREQPEAVGQLGTLPDAFGIFILVLGFLLLAWGVLQVVASIFVLSNRTWARIAAIILAILGALAGLATILPGPDGVNPVGAVISLMVVGANVFAIWALTANGGWFSRA